MSIKTISIEPQPLSMTDSGGKMMAKITLQILIILKLLVDWLISKTKNRIYIVLLVDLSIHLLQIIFNKNVSLPTLKTANTLCNFQNRKSYAEKN